MKLGPPPPGPVGGDFLVFLVFLLKILEGGQIEFWNFKKGDINPQKFLETPPGRAPWGIVFRFLKSFFPRPPH